MKYALAVLLLVSCDPGDDRLDSAKEVVRSVFVADGYEPPRSSLIFVLEYPDGCLPDPWNFGEDPVTDQWSLSDGRCRRGRALYFYFAGVVALARSHSGLYADTSLAHEIMHLAILDPYHQWDAAAWANTVPSANARLREEGL